MTHLNKLLSTVVTSLKIETLHLLWFEIKIRITNSQLSFKRPTLLHDKEVAYGKNQQSKPKVD